MQIKEKERAYGLSGRNIQDRFLGVGHVKESSKAGRIVKGEVSGATELMKY